MVVTLPVLWRLPRLGEFAPSSSSLELALEVPPARQANPRFISRATARPGLAGVACLKPCYF